MAIQKSLNRRISIQGTTSHCFFFQNTINFHGITLQTCDLIGIRSFSWWKSAEIFIWAYDVTAGIFCKQNHVSWFRPMLFQCKKKTKRYTVQFWSLFIENYHINIDLLHMMLEGWISQAVGSRFVLQRSMKDEKTRQIFGPEFAKLWSFRVLDWIS